MARRQFIPSHEAKTLKTCATCGTDFRTTPKDWERRVYCSHSCKWTIERERRRTIVAVDIGQKRCAVCSVVLVRGDNEDAGNFRTRQTCSKACHVAVCAKRLTKPTPVRSCQVCSEPLIQRAKERRCAFIRRKTCSDTCRRVLTGPERVDPSSRFCIVCGVAFDRSSSDTLQQFMTRETCSTECRRVLGGQRRRIVVSHDPCVWCGSPVIQRSNEATTSYRTRKTCGVRCRFALTAATQRARSRGTNPYPAVFRREVAGRIRLRDAHTCRICSAIGGRRNHPVHHINYDKEDLCESNLITLCASCHSKTNVNREYWKSIFTAMMEEREDIAA